MTEVKTPGNIVKYTFIWIAVMLTINIITAGYYYTSTNNVLNIDQQDVYQYIANSPIYDLINDISSTSTNASTSDITSQGSIDNTGFSVLETLANFVAWIIYIVGLITLGGIFNTMLIWTITENIWFRLFAVLFLIPAQLIYYVLIYKWVLNKFKIE